MLDMFPESLSTYSGEIDSLFMLITYLVGFWFIVSEVALFYLVIRFMRKDGVKAQYIGGDTKKQLAWVFVPLSLIVLCDLWIDIETASVWNMIKQNNPPAEQKIRVIGQQWSWIFVHPGPDGKLDTADDISTVDELHVKVNTLTHYELESRDVLHNFSVPVFRLKQDAIPGRKITGWFEATQTGEFDIQCAEMCGSGHGVMGARIKIESTEGYEQWMASVAKQREGFVTASNARQEYAELLNSTFN